MKRYHLFMGEFYYPARFEDYVRSYYTRMEAIKAAGSEHKTELHEHDGWWEVVESTDDGLVLVDSGIFKGPYYRE